MRFASYDSEYDATEFPLLKANEEIILGPFYTQVEGPNISFAGSAYADKAGEAIFEQSFDGGKHYDIVEEKTTVSGSTATTLGPFQILAPICRLRYKNGAAAQTEIIRVFASINGGGGH